MGPIQPPRTPVRAARELRIRRYAPADHATVLALHRECLARVGLRPGDGVYYEHDLFRMEEVYFAGGGDFLVGELAGEPVAMAGLRPAGPGEAEMVRLRVRPDHQRRGHGGALVRAIETRAAELGHRLLRCDTTVLQAPALALYRRHGWYETGRRTVGGIVNVHLAKEL